jgi:hypothetical protein
MRICFYTSPSQRQTLDMTGVKGNLEIKAQQLLGMFPVVRFKKSRNSRSNFSYLTQTLPL